VRVCNVHGGRAHVLRFTVTNLHIDRQHIDSRTCHSKKDVRPSSRKRGCLTHLLSSLSGTVMYYLIPHFWIENQLSYVYLCVHESTAISGLFCCVWSRVMILIMKACACSSRSLGCLVGRAQISLLPRLLLPSLLSFSCSSIYPSCVQVGMRESFARPTRGPAAKKKRRARGQDQGCIW